MTRRDFSNHDTFTTRFHLKRNFNENTICHIGTFLDSAEMDERHHQKRYTFFHRTSAETFSFCCDIVFRYRYHAAGSYCRCILFVFCHYSRGSFSSSIQACICTGPLNLQARDGIGGEMKRQSSQKHLGTYTSTV